MKKVELVIGLENTGIDSYELCLNLKSAGIDYCCFNSLHQKRSFGLTHGRVKMTKWMLGVLLIILLFSSPGRIGVL